MYIYTKNLRVCVLFVGSKLLHSFYDFKRTVVYFFHFSNSLISFCVFLSQNKDQKNNNKKNRILSDN